jgi:hypothetical protein
MFLTFSELGNTFVNIAIQDLPIQIGNYSKYYVQVMSIYIVYLLFDSDTDLNALKDSISYLRASDRDCWEAPFSVVFPVNR